MGSGKRWIALVATGIGVAAVAPGAGGRIPVAHIACAQTATNCSEQGNTPVPGHGTATQSTDIVPNGATKASDFIEPLSASDLAVFDSTWEDVVYAYPNLSGITSKPLRRALTCAVIARASAATVASVYKVQEHGEVVGSDLYAAFLSVCIQVTVLAQRSAGSASASSSASIGCAQANVRVPVLVSHSRSGYVFQLTGRTSKATGRGSLAVSCRVKGTGLLINQGPRARGRRLRQVIGHHLSIGFSNPTNKSLTIHTVFSFK